jgi:hypothetical protein
VITNKNHDAYVKVVVNIASKTKNTIKTLRIGLDSLTQRGDFHKAKLKSEANIKKKSNITNKTSSPSGGSINISYKVGARKMACKASNTNGMR